MSKENPQANKRFGEPAIRAFDAKNIGKSLLEVAAEYIKTEEQDIETRWFHSAQDADLFIWRDERKNVIKQQVSFFGQIAEWNLLEGVRTGVVIETEPDKKMAGSQLVQFDSNPVKTTLEQGVEILAYTLGLKDTERRQLIDNFLASPQLAKLSAEEIFARYHIRGADPEFQRSSGIFSWLKKLALAVGFKALGKPRQNK